MNEVDLAQGAGALPVAFYRGFQRWLKATFSLIAAFKDAQDERSAVTEFVDSLTERWGTSPRSVPGREPSVLFGMKFKFGVQGDLVTWIQSLPVPALLDVEKYLLGTIGIEIHGLRLFGEQVGRQRSIDARYVLATLEDAIEWMVWFGEFNKHPVICCRECYLFFRGESAHARKFCSQACARRQTSRNWNRKKRSMKEEHVNHKTK